MKYKLVERKDLNENGKILVHILHKEDRGIAIHFDDALDLYDFCYQTWPVPNLTLSQESWEWFKSDVFPEYNRQVIQREINEGRRHSWRRPISYGEIVGWKDVADE